MRANNVIGTQYNCGIQISILSKEFVNYDFKKYQWALILMLTCCTDRFLVPIQVFSYINVDSRRGPVRRFASTVFHLSEEINNTFIVHSFYLFTNK